MPGDVTFGLPVNNRAPNSTDAGRFEMIGPGPYDSINMPISWKGVTKGLGTNGVGGGVNPAKLADGFFMTLKTYAEGSAGTDNGFGADNTAGGPFRAARGTEFYDYAPDATKPLVMVFSADTQSSSGDENRYYQDDNSTENADFEPGAFYAEAISGVQGTFNAWFPLTHVQEANLNSYTKGTKLTVQKGRLKIAATGEFVIGEVVEKYSSTKIHARISLTGANPIAP